MKAPAKPAEIVWVHWLDAVGESTRAYSSSIGELALAHNINIGWIIHRNDSRIILAHGTSDSGEVDVFAIPQSCILKIVPIQPQRPNKAPKNGKA